ncbi:distal membrane-arm assembly complex protein 1-like [Puntigrus tetrazona]|uniref:distal membrane-arm assembly complex protein 1-like n=1 Tax=Puntigrus tetrazona TaxID=1606681 RepID=UPI001C8AB2B9|nr:distal membrane-arm assembly complex protein 1-like [Puntigrus tetrazona]
MSNPPPVPEKSSPQATILLGDCWSCRMLLGSGLLTYGGYVGMQARRAMSPGGPPSLGIAVQFMFAAGLAAWGVVVMVKPAEKYTRVA